MEPLENVIFEIPKEFGPQMRLQILSLMICAGVGSGVWPIQARAMKKKLKIAKIWTTPVDGILPVYYKGLLGNHGTDHALP